MSLKTLSSEEIRQILKISRRTQDLWLKSGKLKGYRVGRRWLFKEEDIEALLMEPKDPSSEAPSGLTDGQKLLRAAGFLNEMSDAQINQMVSEIYKRRMEAKYRKTN